jgi:hypothetical protein
MVDFRSSEFLEFAHNLDAHDQRKSKTVLEETYDVMYAPRNKRMSDSGVQYASILRPWLCLQLGQHKPGCPVIKRTTTKPYAYGYRYISRSALSDTTDSAAVR